MLFDAGNAQPTSVLVHGAAGGVATAVLQLAQAHGMLAIGTASTAQKADAARAAGALHVIDRSTQDVHGQVMNSTGGRGVDLVLDHVGGPGFVANLDLLAPRRRALMLDALRLMGEGRLRPLPATVFGLSEVRRAHEALDAGGSAGKIVLMPGR